MNLNSMDVVLVRQDPPFNMNYITATYLLEKLSDKVLVINNPKHIRDYPEKLSMFDFDKIIPPTLVSGDLQEILQFNKKNKKFKIIWQKKHTLKFDEYQKLNLIVHFFIMLKNQRVVKKLKLNCLQRNTILLQENMKCLWKKNYLHTVNSITFF